MTQPLPEPTPVASRHLTYPGNRTRVGLAYIGKRAA